MTIDPKYPHAPVTVGTCACGGEIWEYEAETCPECYLTVHAGCIEKCAACGHTGCRNCLEQHPEMLDWLCGPECRAAYERQIAEADAELSRRLAEGQVSP